jgi:hypothetical protein
MVINKLKFLPGPGLLIVKPIVIEPKNTMGVSNKIIRPETVTKTEDFHQMEEYFDVHPYQAEIMCIGQKFNNEAPNWDYVPGDIVYMYRALGIRDAVLIENNLYAVIRQSDIIGKVVKLND